VDRIQAESHERLVSRDHAGERRAMVSMMLFESADLRPPADGAPAKKRRSRTRA
jgi:hypothetical protein